MKKANKKEEELGVGLSFYLLTSCDSFSAVKNRVTEEYELIIRYARRISAKSMGLIVKDFDEINMDPLMVVKPLVNLEEGI